MCFGGGIGIIIIIRIGWAVAHQIRRRGGGYRCITLFKNIDCSHWSAGLVFSDVDVRLVLRFLPLSISVAPHSSSWLYLWMELNKTHKLGWGIGRVRRQRESTHRLDHLHPVSSLIIGNTRGRPVPSYSFCGQCVVDDRTCCCTL